MYPYGMKATKAVLCPKCGALNRPTWEFCARCNESLEGATSVDESVGSAATATRTTRRQSAAPANTIALAGVLAVVIVARCRPGARSRTAPDAAAPDPSVFTMGTQPPELPTPGPGTAAGRHGLRRRPPRPPLGRPGGGGGAAGRGRGRRPRERGVPERLRPCALAQRRPRGGARSPGRGGSARPAPADAVRALARRGRPHGRRGRPVPADPRQEPHVLDRARGPGPPALPQRRLPGSGVPPAERGPVAARRPRAAAGARLLARPGGRPRAGRGGLSQGPREGPGGRDQPRTAGREPRRAGPEGRGAWRCCRRGCARHRRHRCSSGRWGPCSSARGGPADAAAAYRAYAELAPGAPDAKDLLARAARLDAVGGKP